MFRAGCTEQDWKWQSVQIKFLWTIHEKSGTDVALTKQSCIYQLLFEIKCHEVVSTLRPFRSLVLNKRLHKSMCCIGRRDDIILLHESFFSTRIPF